jgi:polyisoprenoid-binding protein YceI
MTRRASKTKGRLLMRLTVHTHLRRFTPIALAAALATCAWTGLTRAETLALDPNHTHVGFSIRHFFTQVKGEFKGVSGTLDIDPKNLNASKVSVDIDPATINTNNDRRDNHLRSADFFDVEKFPKMTFVVTAVNFTDAKEYKGTLTGDLTMHGVTKPVTLTIESGGMQSMGPGGTVAGFTASGTLNRKDYGIIWNKVFDQGPAMLGDDVALEIDVEAHTPMQPKPTAAATPAPTPAPTSK